MIPFKMKALSAAVLLLTACGGGGGGGGDSLAGIDNGPAEGISGSGATASGTIDGFGSIFVNGVEFETDEADITVDGRPASESDLRIGMVVLVKGTVNDDGVTGNAQRVIFDDEVEGPISAIQTGQDNDSKLITVLGIEIIVERTGTVFDDVSFDTLAIDDVVEVSGFPEGGTRLRATRIEKKANFVAGETEIEVKGTVSGLTDSQFNLGDFIVEYANADLSELNGELADGQGVEVYGTLAGNVITATKVESEDDITDLLDDDDDFSVQGAIRNFTSAADFEINGVKVNASNARRSPAGLNLADGVVVEAEGTWDGAVLTAQTVEARRGRIEIEAAVTSVDSSSVTLGFVNGEVTVQVDARTLLDDDTGQIDTLTLADIRSGDFLEVEALRDGDRLIATRIDRDDRDDDVLQAPVDSFNAGSDITLLGITFSIAGTEFEDRNDNPIDATSFFNQLQAGDLIKVEDEEIADGIADEIEFEFEDRQDGGFEFDDDSDDFDDSNDPDDTSDDSGSDDSTDDSSESGSDSDDSTDDSSNSGSGSDDSTDDNSGSGSGSDDSTSDSSNSGSGSDDGTDDSPNSGSG